MRATVGDTLGRIAAGRTRQALAPAAVTWMNGDEDPAGVLVYRAAQCAYAFFSSWYSSSVLVAQMFDLSVRPAIRLSTAVIEASIEWSWLL